MNRSDSKKIILQRIRQALTDVEQSNQPTEIDRNYRTRSQLSDSQLIGLFADRVSEYQAEVKIVDSTGVEEAIYESLRNRNVKNVVVAPGFQDVDVISDEFTVLRDEPVPLTNHQLDESDAVLTTCFLGIAETGTIVLNSGEGQGRRALTLIPDFHICVVPASRILGNVPEAISELDKLVREHPAPITFISGPSATSDIELNRVEGVHGPRTLHVIISHTK